MNIEQPVVGVSNCIIRSIIRHLTSQNLNGREIYRDIMETSGEKLFVR